MKSEFFKAKKILRTGNTKFHVIAVNGCCYGKNKHYDKGDFLKLCGQEFWEFISGDESLYARIIEPIGFKARERNDSFNVEYSKLLNRMTMDFSRDFCSIDGSIDWDKLIKYNSSKD